MIRKTTLKDDWKVGRVIARPFTGQYPNFVRTANRHDYALNPKEPTVLDKLKDAKYDVISVGKIADIFNNCGITESNKTADNTDGIRKIMEMVRKDFKGLCFINLNDFDSKYGHRRDAVGYADALREFDEAIPHMLSRLRDDDLLIITADHGNDPTFRGTDHTRENVPVFIFSPQFKTPGKLEDFETFANIGATIAENFNVAKPSIGESILRNLK
jgi:phosphopentomutase